MQPEIGKKVDIHFSENVLSEMNLPLQVLFYEAKVPTLDEYSTIKKCSHTIEHRRHYYHTSALSNEVCNFVLAQGAQKLSAK